MPFLRPTIAKIRARTTSDFEYELGAQVARIPGTPERAFVQALAGASHGLHGRLAWISRNAFAHSADDEELARWAAFFGVYKIPAERAAGEAYFTGTPGSTVPANTVFTRDDGVQYETLEELTLVGVFGTVAARCLTGGVVGNATIGTVLTLGSPITGIDSAVYVVAPGFEGGVNEETTAALRTRLLERLDNPPNGGGPGSYVAWAKKVAGVTRVWEYGKVPSLGHVTVLFMRDDDDVSPFPDGGEVTAVETKILEYAPLHLAGLHVQAPIDYPLTLEIQLTPSGDADLQTAVVASIQAMLQSSDIEPAPADGTTFYKSKIAQAIGNTPGVTDYKLNVPVGDITLMQWELPTLKAIGVTFV